MRVLRHPAVILFVLATLSLVGQQLHQDRPEPFYFVALTDPACPVTRLRRTGSSQKEIRVLDYPMGEGVTIKNPKSPVVHMVFDNGYSPDSDQTLSFAKPDAGPAKEVSLQDKKSVPQLEQQ